MINKLLNYSNFFESIVEKTEMWKDVLWEEGLVEDITETEQMQYVMMMSRIYETEFKKLSQLPRHDSHKDIILKYEDMDVTYIVSFIWELNNGIKHGEIKPKKLINILKNSSCKNLFKVQFENFEKSELHDILFNNAILFDFNDDILKNVDRNKYEKYCENIFSNISLDIGDVELEEMNSNEELQDIKKLISKGLLSYYYSQYFYDDYNKEEILSNFHIKYYSGKFCEKYYDLDRLFRIAYFYNELLIKLLSDEKIKMYRKIYTEEEIT